jgi:sporulation protein YlmC with PRC-barrel domain
LELSIQNCFGFEVLTRDEKKIGALLNLIINKLSYEATLVVFPGLKSEWAFSKAGKAVSSAGGLGTRFLQRMLPELYDVVDAASEIQSEVVSEVSQRTDRKATEIGSTYYCIPSANVENVEEEALTLNLDNEECVSWYKNAPISPDAEFVFFDDRCYKGPERQIPISLNLQAARGMLIYDPKGLSGRITDVKFDPASGNVTGFDMIFRNETKSLGIDFLQKDYDRFLTTIPFQDNPSAESQTQSGFTVNQKLYLDSTKTDIARRIMSGLNRPKTIQEIAFEIGCADSSAIINDLADLEQQGVIICLTPDREKDKQFYLTNPGLKIRQVLLGQLRFEELT